MNRKGFANIVLVGVVIVIIAIIGIIFFGEYISKVSTLDIDDRRLMTGVVVNSNIQTPHPYPNSESGRQIVWSYTLSDPSATALGLHFKDFDVAGIINPTSHVVEYPVCVPSGFDPGGQSVPEVPGAIEERCGNVTVLYTLQEIYDNNYLDGDFFLVKDINGNILDILTRNFNGFISLYNDPNNPQPEREGNNWRIYSNTNSITIELYADESDNTFGLHIDKYLRGTWK